MNRLNSTSKLSAVRSMQGMSLVELMIAMVLGLLLMGGMITVFSGNKRSSDLNSAMANMQENARFVLNTISRDLRMAGYQGCLNPMEAMMKVNSADSPIPEVGFDASGEPMHDFNASSATGAVVINADQFTPEIPGGFTPPDDNEAVPGTNVLAVQFADSRSTALTGPVMVDGVPSPNGPISTEEDLDFEVGDLALIANCDMADLFTVSGIDDNGGGQILEHGVPLNSDGSLDGYYGRPNNIAMTRVMRFSSNIYYVADTGLENDAGDPIRALYQQSYPYNNDDNPPSEIAQGIENLRLSFGLRDNGTLRYVTADDPTFDPAIVESVQIGVMMTSWDDITEQDDTNTYLVAGQAIPAGNNPDDGLTHATDRRFRLVFNTTVKIRNRLRDGIIAAQIAAGA